MRRSTCVLVCVRGKEDYEDLVSAGNAIAKKNGSNLSVLTVLPTRACFSPDFDILTSLSETAKKYNADFNVLFSDSPAMCTAQYVQKGYPLSIVTGFPGINSSHFVSHIYALLPDIPINMVKGNKIFHISDALLADGKTTELMKHF
ncbi:MAG: hypothetical protein LBH71_01385 [Oscillospiraceae bacterium]|nr:hypothetical protein [Oscillospiraceae bacterium]